MSETIVWRKCANCRHSEKYHTSNFSMAYGNYETCNQAVGRGDCYCNKFVPVKNRNPQPKGV